ncbi:MAG: hypothetical protein QW620_08630 [Thermoplasmata archaeon]
MPAEKGIEEIKVEAKKRFFLVAVSYGFFYLGLDLGISLPYMADGTSEPPLAFLLIGYLVGCWTFAVVFTVFQLRPLTIYLQPRWRREYYIIIHFTLPFQFFWLGEVIPGSIWFVCWWIDVTEGSCFNYVMIIVQVIYILAIIVYCYFVIFRHHYNYFLIHLTTKPKPRREVCRTGT